MSRSPSSTRKCWNCKVRRHELPLHQRQKKNLVYFIFPCRAGLKFFGVLDETIKLCHFHYFNIIFLVYFVAKNSFTIKVL